VAPLVPDSVTGSPRDMALHGLNEMRTWLGIGFDLESNKGTAMLSLDYALRVISTAIEKTPADATSIMLSRRDLGILHGCSFQLGAAAHTLETIFAKMHKAPRQVAVTDLQSSTITYGLDFNNVIAVWNRPNADHAAVAEQLRESQKRLDLYLTAQGIKPAGDTAIRHYLPYDPKKSVFD
jgi:hypothetical protein